MLLALKSNMMMIAVKLVMYKTYNYTTRGKKALLSTNTIIYIKKST